MRARLPLLLALGVAFGIALLAPRAHAQDRVMMQGFYWDAEPGGVWYDTLTTEAARLGWAGFDAIWIPPPSKGAASQYDVGYTPYDYYDLGGYDSCGGNNTQGQGGCTPTRYGTVAGLKEAVRTLQEHGLEVYADVVLNHRSGGTLEPNAYGNYYTGGGSLYGEGGETYTAFPLTHGSGRIAWADGDEHFFPNASNNPGNTGDFYGDAQLAGFHQMYVNGFGYDNALHNGFGQNLATGDSLMAWGHWLTTELGLDGYRFDFVKGVHPEYLKRWVDHGAMRGKFHVHELYDGDRGRLKTYLAQLDGSERAPAVFDFSLRFAYKDVLDGGAPIYRWHDAGLINEPGVPFDQIVSFVDNHDFDRLNYEGQVTVDGHSPVVSNKMLAYAHMLTHPGTATVWWRDYYHYGLGGAIDELVRIRKAFASGPYHALTRPATGNPFWPTDRENPANPWESLYVGQRNGDGPGQGVIVAINKSQTNWAHVFVTQQNGAWTNKTLKDLTGNGGGGTTQVFGDNRVLIWAPPNSYTVWVPENYELAAAPPVPAPDAPSYYQVDFANLQWPPEAEVGAGEATAFYARAYAHGLTDETGAAAGLSTWIGYSTDDTDPSTWSDWVPAAYHGDVADATHLDEFTATLSLSPGTYHVASRFQLGDGPYRYGGFSDGGGGFWDGEASVSAVLTVTAPTYALSGTATAEGGGPLAGAVVTLSADGHTPLTDVTDAAGAFSFAGVADGSYALDISYAGYAFDAAPRTIAVSGTDVAGLDFVGVPLPVQVGPIVAPVDPVAVGTAVSVSAPFTDPSGTGLATATWSWGDGTPEDDPSAAGTVDEVAGLVAGSHTYATAGVYTVTLAVTNGLGGEGTAAYRYVVAYDPSAGFVTGGGWIDSPEGAYPANPDLVGKAHFGFVARYKRGQQAPDGNTQFRFQAAGLAFHSTAYEWLVVAGPKAQYKGTGTINGSGDYGFMLTARDGDASGGADGGGGTDRLRMKIWDRASGGVVYDNQPGDAEDADAATALGGGSVTIHTGGAEGVGGKSMTAGGLPEAFTLAGVYPNPLRSSATVAFEMPEAAEVRLVVYDVLGRVVARLVDGPVEAGRHEAVFDGSGLPSGTYLVRMTTDGASGATFAETRRITVVR